MNKRLADQPRVQAEVQNYRPDLAEMFDSKMSRRDARKQARRYAQKRTGFGVAEILLFVQVLMALWTVWQKYQERQASFTAATNTDEDPELTVLVASVAEDSSE